MFLDKFVENLVGDFFNLVIVELFYQPVQDISLYPEVSFVNIWNVVFVVDQSRQSCNSKAGRLLLISNLSFPKIFIKSMVMLGRITLTNIMPC